MSRDRTGYKSAVRTQTVDPSGRAVYKAWVCGRLFAGIVGSNPARGHGYLSAVGVVCCQVEVSVTG